jgi:hypothetical protein
LQLEQRENSSPVPPSHSCRSTGSRRRIGLRPSTRQRCFRVSAVRSFPASR